MYQFLNLRLSELFVILAKFFIFIIKLLLILLLNISKFFSISFTIFLLILILYYVFAHNQKIVNVYHQTFFRHQPNAVVLSCPPENNNIFFLFHLYIFL